VNGGQDLHRATRAASSAEIIGRGGAAGTGLWGEICCTLGRRWIGADVKQGGSNKVVL
jgi:hypothetical protein